MIFEEYKKEMIEGLSESVRLFSNKGKKKLEIWVVKKFLNSLNLTFTEDEIIQVVQCKEPPDITFRDACFEVMELYDENRQRHKEYKDRLHRIETATSYSDVLEPGTWDIEALSFQELLAISEACLHEKKGDYSMDTKTKLDVLIYVNLRKITIDDEDFVFTPIKDSGLTQWRSVSLSLVFNRDIVCVAHASNEAPEFIRNLSGKIIKS